MNNPYILDHTLTTNNLAGNRDVLSIEDNCFSGIDTYNQDITFSGSLLTYAFVGRYNYELSKRIFE